ncbi:MAG: hypothetical protein KDK34_07525 [Leptospiraceae bacterium]|nr:hypothetical protein [Leptospiraceae bacterium]
MRFTRDSVFIPARWAFRIGIGLVMICLQFHCATYWQNRGGDFGDIWTAGVERQVYGATAQVGPLQAGLAHQSHGIGIGLRAGTTGTYLTGKPDEDMYVLDTGNSILLLNSTGHRGQDRDKDYGMHSITPLVLYAWEGYNTFFQVEVSVGMYGGVRLGLNLAELCDFLLGWTTLDLLRDDQSK